MKNEWKVIDVADPSTYDGKLINGKASYYDLEKFTPSNKFTIEILDSYSIKKNE